MIGIIAQASVHQTVQLYGEPFTIRRKVATSYDTATSTAQPVNTEQTVKGFQDDGRENRLAALIAAATGQTTDVRSNRKAVIIAAKDLAFIPGVGDVVESGGLRDSIREAQELKGPQGVVLFYRMVLENG